ncbi:MAG TPA: ABC transporter substrate-binding protein [Chloroflexota bacterium]
MRAGRTHLGLLALIGSTLLSACAPSAQTPGGGAGSAPANPQRTLVMALRSEPPSVASLPLRAAGLSVASAVRLFNAELDYVDDREQTHPYLAEELPKLNTDSWKVFPDGRMETTYRLKPNLTWQDGVPLSANDFAFARRVYGTPEFLTSAARPLSLTTEVLAPDPRTVVIRWRQPYPDADSLKNTFQALPRHILEQPYAADDPDAFAAEPFWGGSYIGLGPYKVEHWEPGASIDGVAFAGHVLGRPKIERVRVVFMGDPNVVVAGLLAGSLTAAVDNSLNSDQAAVVEREWNARGGAGVVLYVPSQFRATEVQFRPEYANPPEVLDVRVRQAMLHAMDRKALNDTLIAGKGILADSPISPTEPYYSTIESRIRKYPFDMRRTEQLLTEAGLTKGTDGFFNRPNGERFRPELWCLAGGNNDLEIQIQVDGFRNAGIEVTSKILPFALFPDTKTRSTFPAFSNSSSQTFVMLHGAPPGPQNQFLGGGGRMGWANSEFDGLLDTSQSTLDHSEWIKLQGEMARVVSEDLPLLPIYFNVRVTAYGADLQGPLLGTTPTSGSDSWNVYQWEWRS